MFFFFTVICQRKIRDNDLIRLIDNVSGNLEISNRDIQDEISIFSQQILLLEHRTYGSIFAVIYDI